MVHCGKKCPANHRANLAMQQVPPAGSQWCLPLGQPGLHGGPSAATRPGAAAGTGGAR